jgi:Xaa-Pro aminopeptidase
MEYSAECRIPMLSQVDAGTIEMIRKMGIEVISSASFLQYLTCCWSPRQLELHRQAAQVLDHTANACWEWIESRLKTSVSTTEYDIQQFILDQIVQAGCEADTAPICGINQNSANPHYAPSSTKYITLKVGDWILIDLWCKKKEAHAVYADITRVAVASHRPTPLQEQLFSVVSSAQKQATEFVRRKIEAGEEIRGWEVDRVARNVVESAGFGNYFIHRTGHNIHEENHGPGANMDSYETYDDRRIIPNTCFSIEPGIYLTNQFGVRLEYDVFIHADKRIELNGGVQDSIVCLD